METPAHTTQTLRFGVFEVDAREGKLCRSGIPIRIQEQPFRILIVLLEHAGELVTRDLLRTALWPSDTFVDFEHGLNTAIMKLREALEDSAETPLYIETIPRRGYRFIAPLLAQDNAQRPPENQDSELLAPALHERNDMEHPTRTARPRYAGLLAPVASALVVLILFIAATAVLLNVRNWRDKLFVRSPQIHALAVLPFTNLSGDPKLEYFSEGITVAIITELGRIGGPRVLSRQSTMRFKGSQKSMEQIAQELKVDAIVEGAVEQCGDRVRITVHLARGNPEQQLWVEQYDRDTRDVLSVQAEIAHTVANEIRVRLSSGESRNAPSGRSGSPQCPVSPEPRCQVVLPGSIHN